MDDWLDRFADSLGVPRLAAEDVEVVLDLARIVAHGTERKNAPLAAFLAGRWAALTGGDATGAFVIAGESLAFKTGGDTDPGT